MNVTKEPTAVLDYSLDWDALDFLADGEEIVSYTVTVPAGLVKDQDSLDNPVIKVWLSGGTLGEAYLIPVHIITNQGRQATRTFRVQIRNK